MAQTNYSTKFPFAALPMRWFPTKELRRKANQAVVEIIAWDSPLTHCRVLGYAAFFSCVYKNQIA